MLKKVNDVKTFIFGGKAEFTIKNEVSNNKYKYKVNRSKTIENIFFVKVKVGNDWQYAGFLNIKNDNASYGVGKKGTMDATHPAIKGLMYAIHKGHAALPEPMIMFHHGKCACCGRKLDDDDSIDRGIGPVCWKKYIVK